MPNPHIYLYKKKKKKRAALAKIAVRFQKYNFEILNTYFNKELRL